MNPSTMLRTFARSRPLSSTRASTQRHLSTTFFSSATRRTLSKPKALPSSAFFTRNTTHATPPSLLQSLRARFLHTTRIRRAAGAPAELGEANLTLGQRLKKLSREYGWSALGVYFMLSALDFPFCYLFVRTLGTDRIGRWEEIVMSNIKKMIPETVKQRWHDWRASVKQAEREKLGSEGITDTVEMAGWGVEEAEAKNKRDASLATQLALAYAIHKSFIFIRVPLTAAVTPKVVKVLRGWGWDIGKRTTKAAKAAKRAEAASK